MADVPAARAAATPAVANSSPLGLSAFALTTFVLSSSNAGFLFSKPATVGTAAVLGLALFYGGLVQLIAGIQAFRNGNTFAATAFCSYAGFWLALGFILLPLFTVTTGTTTTAGNSVVSLLGSNAATGVGVFLLGWTIFTGLMFLSTLRSTLVTMAVFGFLFLTFLALTIGWLAGGPSGSSLIWIQIGGWLGIVTALIAWYDALAGVVIASGPAAFRLPTWPRS